MDKDNDGEKWICGLCPDYFYWPKDSSMFCELRFNAEYHIEIDPTKQQNCNNEKVDNISK